MVEKINWHPITMKPYYPNNLLWFDNLTHTMCIPSWENLKWVSILCVELTWNDL